MDLVITSQAPAQAPAAPAAPVSYADAQIARIARGARRTRALVMCLGALLVGALLVRLGGVEEGTPTTAGVVVEEPAPPAAPGVLGAMALRTPTSVPETQGGPR